MKETLLLLACLITIFSSCKKNDETTSSPDMANAKKYPVEFRIKDFDQYVEKLGSKSPRKLASVSGAGDTLEVSNDFQMLLYDKDGNEISRIWNHGGWQEKMQLDTTEGEEWEQDHWVDYGQVPRGVVRDSLPQGSYTAVFLTSKEGPYTLDPYANVEPPGRSNLKYASVWFNWVFFRDEEMLPTPNAGDMFFKKIAFNVGESAVVQPVTLDRIVGKLEVNITDRVPESAWYLTFDIEYDALSFHFDSESGRHTADSSRVGAEIKPSERGQLGYRYEKFLLNTTTPMKITISCYDIYRKLIAQKTVNSVRIHRNRRTILTGKLFDNRVESGFNVTLNSKWDEETEEIPF